MPKFFNASNALVKATQTGRAVPMDRERLAIEGKIFSLKRAIDGLERDRRIALRKGRNYKVSALSDLILRHKGTIRNLSRELAKRAEEPIVKKEKGKPTILPDLKTDPMKYVGKRYPTFHEEFLNKGKVWEW